MAISILRRATAWLCLAVALLTGLSPAQGFVICLEPDGCVSFEIPSAAETCGGCGNHQEGDTSTKTVVRGAEVVDCPCIDLPVPSSSQDRRLQRKSIELEPGSWIADPSSSPAPPFFPAPPTVGAVRPEAPRPAESLDLIRSVVLLV